MFTLGISVVAGALLGLVPALQSTRPDVAVTLKSETAGGGQPGQLKWRSVLVVTQLTVSLLLLVGAGLFLRSAQEVQAVDPGFGRDPTAVMTFMVPTQRYTEDEGRRYTERLLERFRQLPGVSAVGIIDRLHLNVVSNQSIGFNVDGVEPPPDLQYFSANRAAVDPAFFAAAGIQIVRGRNFDDTDLPDNQRVGIISEATARRFFENGDAVGRMLRRLGNNEDLLVVGIASDARVRSLGGDPELMVYQPYSQAYAPFLTVVAKTNTDPARTALALMNAGRDVDPDFWVWETKNAQRASGHHVVARSFVRVPPLGLRPARVAALEHRTLRCGELRRCITHTRDGDSDGSRRGRSPCSRAPRGERNEAGGVWYGARACRRVRAGAAPERPPLWGGSLRPPDFRRRADSARFDRSSRRVSPRATSGGTQSRDRAQS